MSNKKVRAALAASTMVTAALIGAMAAAGPSSAAPVAAPSRPVAAPNGNDDQFGFAEFTGDGVRIRSCASTRCTVLGLGYRTHWVSWHCGEWANGYVHILDNTTHVDGWSSVAYTNVGCD